MARRAERTARAQRGGPVALAALAVFLLLLVAVLAAWPPLVALDAAVAAGARRVGTAVPSTVVVWTVASAVFAPLTFRVLAVVILLVLWVPRPAPLPSRCHALRRLSHPETRRALTSAALIVLAGGLLPLLIKAAVDRPRPPEALASAAQSSFPSAHAFGVTVAALCVVLLMRDARVRRPTRRGVGAVAGAAALIVCAARVALAVHHLSDVVAGAALAVVWVYAARLARRRWIARRGVSGGGRVPGR